jgi:hypothetical protein
LDLAPEKKTSLEIINSDPFKDKQAFEDPSIDPFSKMISLNHQKLIIESLDHLDL